MVLPHHQFQGTLYIQVISSKSNHYFSDISNNMPKKCFVQKLVSFQSAIHLDIRKFQQTFFRFEVTVRLSFLSDATNFVFHRVKADVKMNSTTYFP